MAEPKKKYVCPVCKQLLQEKEFYFSNNKEKYPPDGRIPQCKKCFTMHIDNWNPDTFLPLLEELDMPYIKSVWNKVLEKYGKDPLSITGTTILGRYVSTMRLVQYNKYRWKDTAEIEEKEEKEKRAAYLQQGYTEEEIEAELKADTMPPKPQLPSSLDQDKENIEPVEPEPDMFEDQLTDEDKLYLRLKWGGAYTPTEWVQLEQLYQEMINSYDIQGAGHIDNLKLMCKTSLKANQLIDANDIEGYQKMSRVYDQLMKSGKFTAAQNKAESGEFIDSVSELVALCEQEGFIPRYYTDGPQDKVDKVLLDLQNYTRSLILDEMNLGSLIENAAKQLQEEQEKLNSVHYTDADIDEEEAWENSLFEDQMVEKSTETQIKELHEFKEFEDAQTRLDEEFLLNLLKDVD